ncbi:barstar family protein [Streptomyces albus]|uniref:barstar family protein n=1 Tax=Streptomyces albus TaxID=1888 RepID=UPI0004C5633E|nr:barstar family protein [Streptomyces albus]
MKLTAGVTVIRPEEAHEVVRAAAAEDCLLFRLSTEGRAGRGAFFDAARRTLPLDPPVVGSRSWDALADSLWEGVHALERGRVVVLWPDAASFAEASPEDFRTAVDVLSDVAESLSDERAAVGRPTEFCVYIGI